MSVMDALRSLFPLQNVCVVCGEQMETYFWVVCGPFHSSFIFSGHSEIFGCWFLSRRDGFTGPAELLYHVLGFISHLPQLLFVPDVMRP